MSHIKNGTWATMLTPFTDDNRIDFYGMEKLLAYYAHKEIDGIFALCQSSELFFLSPQEKADILQFVVQHTPKSMQIIVSGNTAFTLAEQTEEANRLYNSDCSAYVVLPNRFAAPEESDDVLLERLSRFVDAVPDIPLGLYECPYPYKRLVSPKILRYCVQTGRFVFMKDTCCDLQRIRERLDLLSGSGISLFNANAATLLESLRMGASGYCGVMTNLHPEFYVWLCRHFRDEPEKAEQVQQYIGTCSVIEYPQYPVNAKYSLSLQGVPIGLTSRTKDAGKFTASNKLEVEQFTKLSALARGWLQI